MSRDNGSDNPITILLGIVVLAVIGPIFLTYALIDWIRGTSLYREAKAKREVQKLYDKATWLLVGKDDELDSMAFSHLVIKRFLQRRKGRVPSALFLPLFTVAYDLHVGERFSIRPPNLDGVLSPAGDRYRTNLADLVHKLESSENVFDVFMERVLDSFDVLYDAIPDMYLDSRIDPDDEDEDTKCLTVPLVDVVSNIGQTVEDIELEFFGSEALNLRLFSDLRKQIDANLDTTSQSVSSASNPKSVFPSELDAEPREIVNRYLSDTPLRDLFYTDMPFTIPEKVRFEHQWIVAGSGHGKTQTLQHLIASDLDKVAAGEASIVVIDSQHDLIRNISHMRRFYDGDLAGKLCLIDPTDIEYPVALNLFDVGMDRIRSYSKLDQEKLINSAIELYDFVLGSLLSAELTQKQSVMFRYITRLMLHIPDATIQTFREIMEEGGYEKFRPYIQKLQGTARSFFEEEFTSRQFQDTKRQVQRRLYGILENQTFERMFSHPRSKFDMFSEMGAGKVILVNTAKDLLKQNGTEIFGRFFIALIAQAAQERASQEDRLPCFVYIDECADYIDHNVALILEQARKYNVGMILAHQYLGQLQPPRIAESFAANTSIKFAGGLSSKDARAFSHMLRVPPEFIEDQPKGHFAAFVRNQTKRALSLRVPFFTVENMEKMAGHEFDEMRAQMRERYAVHYTEIEQPISQYQEPIYAPDLSGGTDHATPSTEEW